MVAAAGGTRTGRAWVGEHETLQQAGRRMRELGAESVPVRGNDGRMRGVISRDRVVRSIAAGADPKTVTAGETLRLVPEPPAAAAAIGVSQLLAEGVSMVPAARSGHRYRQAASLAG
ncbi:MAG: hypothetical protein LBI49_22565 [Nocardiopsaceae bacterium]|nr:hypothetical protein [Nocardiopsaceae bacterium]